MNHYSVIIVGAGLAGLMAAHTLRDKGIDYLIIDKGRSVGGRMATRRMNEARCDHGAQFFTARSETMKNLVESWKSAGIVNIWTKGFPQMKNVEDLDSLEIYQDGYPRYTGKDGMNSIMKYIASGLSIQVNHKVEKVEVENGVWKLSVMDLEKEKSVSYTADRLILTAPIPQSLEMLNAGSVVLDEQVKSELEKTSYFPCLSALVTLNDKTVIPSPGGIQIAEGKIGFLGDNEQKGISPTTAVTIHGGDKWSRENYHLSDLEALEMLIDAAKPLLGEGEIVEKQFKRWLYSKPENLHPDDFAFCNSPIPVVFAGDIFKRGAVEGAILSGLAAAEWISETE